MKQVTSKKSCASVIMDFLPNDAKNILPTEALMPAHMILCLMTETKLHIAGEKKLLVFHVKKMQIKKQNSSHIAGAELVSPRLKNLAYFILF